MHTLALPLCVAIRLIAQTGFGLQYSAHLRARHIHHLAVIALARRLAPQHLHWL